MCGTDEDGGTFDSGTIFSIILACVIVYLYTINSPLYTLYHNGHEKGLNGSSQQYEKCGNFTSAYEAIHGKVILPVFIAPNNEKDSNDNKLYVYAQGYMEGYGCASAQKELDNDRDQADIELNISRLDITSITTGD